MEKVRRPERSRGWPGPRRRYEPMDGRRYDPPGMGGGRIVPGAAIENNAGAIVESDSGDKAEK